MPTDLFAAVLVDEAWNLRNGIEQPLQSIFDGIFVALELLRAHESIICCWGPGSHETAGGMRPDTDCYTRLPYTVRCVKCVDFHTPGNPFSSCIRFCDREDEHDVRLTVHVPPYHILLRLIAAQ